MGAVALLAGFPLLGCAALPDEVRGTPAATGEERVAPQEESFQLRTRVWGEGNEVRVEGVVGTGAGLDEGEHVDVAVYAPDGALLATTSAPFRATSTVGRRSALSFSARLPDLRGREIRLRIAPHESPLVEGEPCAENPALDPEKATGTGGAHGSQP